jgi:DNA-binding transcriptional LysR family regulator
MDSISITHIRRLDLTLLIVFDRLLEMQNMSDVAAELGLTQSAVSHAVARLRSIFDDQLFIRSGAGVEATPQALRLGPHLRAALAEVRGALQIGRSFDPGSASRRFTLAAPDTIIAVLAPTMLRELTRTAPKCQIIFRMLPPDRAAAAVAAGEVDLAVGTVLDPPKNTIGRRLAAETFGVVSMRDHPRIGKKLDLDTYCRLDHLLVSHDREPHGIVDEILGGIGRKRRIAAVMPHLTLAFATASRSEAIITAPRSACSFAATVFAVDLHHPPIEIPGFDLTLLRQESDRHDPAITWLEALTRAAFQSSVV